jgi:hypothetical protein
VIFGGNKKQQFWNWFIKNQSKLEKFILSNSNDYSIYNELTEKLKRFNDHLFPEITIDEENNYILIITPDGIREGIEPTKEIAEAAPHIKGWKIKKFRQPTDKMALNFQGLEYGIHDIKIWRKFDLKNETVDIAVLIKDYKDDDTRFISLAFLYLDHVLGEFNVLTKVAEIDFLSWNSLRENIQAIDLISLRTEIGEKLYWNTALIELHF